MTPSGLDESDALLRRRLRVAGWEDGEAILAGKRASACVHCSARLGCGAGALAEMVGGTQKVRLPSAMPLAPGDEVVVAMESGAFLGAAIRAYLLPPAALAATAMASLAAGLPDAATAALCIPALALSFLPLARADRRERQRANMRIEGRIGEEGAL
ncbi:SoxR reducing system RseC family protein [Tropicimonas isoalkanivorans]|uniref:Positive regulator of sigma(E), RseC/MucC n=1 Tax=Tropicimonas isoalkanivorans TaxID=441112 RepID=A0A1I1HFL9_9RHOB|nr:SoxR reducing system RseC family protein [Tropicimonas isoalkanivorans]SFC19920.1 positive regulator of sigma(E), RseC/MucC [Tropicimonas isoalkanivorans]